jgi:hypothetical protein
VPVFVVSLEEVEFVGIADRFLLLVLTILVL